MTLRQEELNQEFVRASFSFQRGGFILGLEDCGLGSWRDDQGKASRVREVMWMFEE
jgi:hypothetical protein